MRKTILIILVINIFFVITACSTHSPDNFSTEINDKTQTDSRSSPEISSQPTKETADPITEATEPPLSIPSMTPKPSYEIPASPAYSHIVREGYHETTIKFIKSETSPDDREPTKEYFSADGNLVSLKQEALAQEALKCLYDMTGFQIEECYVSSLKNSEREEIGTYIFKYDENNDNVFFAIEMDNRSGRILGLQILFSKLEEFAAEDFGNWKNPTEDTDASKETIARWYVEHSSIVDWYQIESVEQLSFGAIEFSMAGNGYYDVYLRDDDLLISSSMDV